jgi:hypothetical protein
MSDSFETAFPRLRAVQPFLPLSPELAWATRFNWREDELLVLFWRALQEQQRVAAPQNLEWLSEIAEAAVLDLNDQVARFPDTKGREHRAILFLRMLVTVIPMQATLAVGQRGATYDWALRGLATKYDPSRRFNSAYAFMPFWQEGDPELGKLWMEKLPEWCGAYFLMARDLGSPSDREVAHFAGPCFDMCRFFFDHLPRGSRSLAPTANAMASIASWGIAADLAEAEGWVRQLVEIWHGDRLPAHVRPTVASVFITKANDATGQSVRAWGEEVLRDYGGQLREHERLMFLTATVDSRQQWLALRKDILAEIASLVSAARDMDVYGADAVTAQEARVDLIRPLLRVLINAEDLPEAMVVLSAWYGEPGPPRCDDNVLLINTAYLDGVAFLWPGGAWISGRTSPEGHESVISAQREALGVETDPARGPLLDEEREGIPAYKKGPKLEEAMRRYYRLDQVRAGFKTMARPRSLLVFPTLGDPVQALVGRELGLVLPLEVSLSQAQPYRAVRRVSVWPGSTFYTQFEIDALKAFGARNGWDVEIFDSAGEAEDFRHYYERQGPDVLWVAGHGEFVAHRPRETGLVLDSKDGARILSMRELAGYTVPPSGRRLLVLNACSGATTQGMAGMARIGIAHSIVQPAQAVIGHLWPASQAVSLAFGMLFASHLAGDDVEGAFGRTADEMRTPEQIPALLTHRLGFAPEGLFRIEKDVEELASILAWGCPVLLT